jgi:hypothetical protein
MTIITTIIPIVLIIIILMIHMHVYIYIYLYLHLCTYVSTCNIPEAAKDRIQKRRPNAIFGNGRIGCPPVYRIHHLYTHRSSTRMITISIKSLLAGLKKSAVNVTKYKEILKTMITISIKSNVTKYKEILKTMITISIKSWLAGLKRSTMLTIRY